MKYEKEITIKSEVIKCDHCDNEHVYDLPHRIKQISIYPCSVCKKDTCFDCIGQSTEDGLLCKNCAKIYKIKYFHPGVAIINKKTKKITDIKL